MKTLLLSVVGIAAVALLIRLVVLAMPSKSPRARFYAGDKLSVSWGSLTVHCHYWVEWGADHWHVTIAQVVGRVDDAWREDDFLSRLVAYALRGGKKRVLFIAGKRVVPDPTWPEPPKENA